MTNPMTDPDAYTDEQLEQDLTRVLAQARGEVLNDDAGSPHGQEVL